MEMAKVFVAGDSGTSSTATTGRSNTLVGQQQQPGSAKLLSTDC